MCVKHVAHTEKGRNPPSGTTDSAPDFVPMVSTRLTTPVAVPGRHGKGRNLPSGRGDLGLRGKGEEAYGDLGLQNFAAPDRGDLGLQKIAAPDHGDGI